MIGVGYCVSARRGDNIVASFAPTLQIPNAVPENMAGNMVELAMSHMSKMTFTPDLAILSRTDTLPGKTLLNIRIPKPPDKVQMKALSNAMLIPNL
jgi:hypothetical protein